ncbi:response regulator [Marinicellulosiphila megalodicopiae]|uniref:response regulator n=1 Tax=Marinicellulosiphila megalodicopiae TaxID=2724896 RepID=UPI003BAF631A
MNVIIYCEAKSERQYYQAVCEEIGVIVTISETTAAFKDQLIANDFQLIILSLHLVDIHSFELAGYIRKQLPFINTPIVVMTADNRETVLKDALKAQISDVCEKRHIENLKSILERMNARHKQIDAKILYLEDDKALAGATVSTLNTAGIKVDWCIDLKHAQAFANQNKYDLVLLDTVLNNNESGIDFLIWIRANAIAHNVDIPILVISSFAAADRKIQIFNAGADDFLAKPYVEDELLARVISLIERKRIESARPSCSDPLIEQKRSRFLATIAHDLRSPLNAVLGHLQLLDNSALNAAQLNHVSQAVQSATTLKELIKDLLDFSIIEDDQFKLYPKPNDLHAICNEVFNTVNVTNEKHDLNLVMTMSEDLPVDINIDALRLKQVLLNLLSNALKFTKKGTIHFKIDFNDKTKVASFHIIDTGKGIDEAELASIFDTFTQTDRGSKEASEGFGLGLSICHRLVFLLGGNISVKSKINKGSDFYFDIPLTLNAKQNIDTSQVKPFEKDNPYQVLIVDDNQFNLEVMKGFLKKLNIKNQSANNGLQGLKKLETQRFDAVILDCMMPIMDGYTMAQQMRYESKFDHISIIASSGSFSDTEKQKCLSFGMNDFLPKPIYFPDVKKVLKHAFDRTSLCANRG